MTETFLRVLIIRIQKVEMHFSSMIHCGTLFEPDHQYFQLLKPRNKKERMDPFLIFAAEHRNEVSLANPGINSSSITSVLSSAWRSLDTANKNRYAKMARQLWMLCDSKRPEKPPKLMNCQASPSETKYEELARVIVPIPRIHIVERCGFNKNIGELSEKLLNLRATGVR